MATGIGDAFAKWGQGLNTKKPWWEYALNPIAQAEGIGDLIGGLGSAFMGRDAPGSKTGENTPDDLRNALPPQEKSTTDILAQWAKGRLMQQQVKGGRGRRSTFLTGAFGDSSSPWLSTRLGGG